jgi:hypothetical protein
MTITYKYTDLLKIRASFEEPCINDDTPYNPDICKVCNVNLAEDDGFYVCPNCGVCYEPIINEITYSDNINYIYNKKNIYKRINHFKDVIRKLQGKESIDVPQNILNIIKENFPLTKTVLKKLNLSKYNSHINYFYKYFGYDVLNFPIKIEENIINVFNQINYIYASIVNDRKNFLNYYFILRKILEIINQPTYLIYIPNIKCKCKLIEYNIIWDKIQRQLK